MAWLIRPRRSRWTSLSAKLTAIITIAAAVGSCALLWFVLGAQRQLLMDETVHNAAFLSDTLLSSLERHMFRNERTELLAALRMVASQPLISELRLFDGAGLTHFSMDSREVGHVVARDSRTCAVCHQPGQVSGSLSIAERSRVVQIAAGKRMLATVTPIYNRPACANASCHAHPADRRVLGVLEVGGSLSQVDATLASLQWRTASIALITILGLGLLSIVFTHRTVVGPIAQLADGVQRVAAGDFRDPVPVSGSGEIADLVQAFNAMGTALGDARQQRDALLDSLEQQVQERTAALEQTQDRLVQTEKLSSLGHLAASIAHEINNPLTGILTYAKLTIHTLEHGTPDEPTRGKLVSHLKLVERETRRCTAIVTNLLDFARERPLKVTAVDVNAAMIEALFLIDNQVALKNIRRESDLHPVPTMHADFGQIRQALANILINACDAMPHGGTLWVTSGAPDADHILITVQDTGAGVAAEHMPKLMDPFFTTREGGTGLGLSVVFGIVKRHHGTVTFDSQVGVGTTVRILLPRAGADAAAAPDGQRVEHA